MTRYRRTVCVQIMTSLLQQMKVALIYWLAVSAMNEIHGVINSLRQTPAS